MPDKRFSALRIEGKRAYEYARAGQELPQELAPRQVRVLNLELLEWFDNHSFPAPKEEASEEEKTIERNITEKKDELKITESPKDEVGIGPACRLRMTVSGGFYVRSLCYDLGLKVSSGAYMTELIRTRQGRFKIEDAVPWEDFVEGGKWEDKVVRMLRASDTLSPDDGETETAPRMKDGDTT